MGVERAKLGVVIAALALLLVAATGFVYSGFIITFQNAGTNIGTFSTYAVFNCASGVLSCSRSGSVITATLSSSLVAPGSITSTTSVTATTSVSGATYLTATNCNVNSVSPAACGSAASGVVVVPTTTTTYTVNTTAVTANSRIFLEPITDASGVSGSPTCNPPPTPFIGYPSARTAATSFTFTLPSTTGASCWVYFIVN